MGALIQLVSYGEQDSFLTGNPQMTFFKVVYRRYTNYSIETVEQTINGSSTIDTNNTYGNVNITKLGDLIHKIYVTSDTPSIMCGSKIINSVELKIGKTVIDTQTQEWMDIFNELTTPYSKTFGLKTMIGDSINSIPNVQIPLQFWFCRNPGLALPIISLQHSDINLNFTWGITSEVGVEANLGVTVDYIYLDTDERKRFAKISHEYLIEQVQKQPLRNKNQSPILLNFNHPVKEIIWTSNMANVYNSAKIVLNNHDLFALQEEEYFQLRQPYQYHTTIPNNNLKVESQKKNVINIELPLLKSSFSADNTFPNGYAITDIDETAAGNTLLTEAQFTILTANEVTNIDNTTVFVPVVDTQDTQRVTYFFMFSEMNIEDLIQVGDLVEINVSGQNSVSGSDTEFSTILTTVTLVQTSFGSSVAGGAEADSGHFVGEDGTAGTHIALQFNKPLLAETINIGGNSRIAINTMNLILRSAAYTSRMTKKINCYSFSLNPEEYQPSGTCNFSKIDTAKLVTSSNLQNSDNIYAINYNILRIIGGQCGLAYT